ncbi:MAG: 1,4-alpha-glucan branching protein [Proteobacteria bacterium]|nr:MAG: 1,4-alpha-glucan branching protein [Pseudomonadota bacterium]
MIRKKFFKTKDEVEVTFELDGGEAEEAAVACEHHDWEPMPMKRASRGKGPFRLRMRLPKGGAYQFKYLVGRDEWLTDSSADGVRPNAFGTMNSVVSTAG